jgi:hypothetical protein
MTEIRALKLVSSIGLLLTACAPARPSLRNELTLQGDATQTQDGLTITARLMDVSAVTKDPRLSRNVRVMVGGLLPKEMPWMIVDPPVFELRILNRTGHVVNLHDTVIKLMDNAGNAFDPVNLAMASAALENDVAAARTKGYEISAQGMADLRASVNQIKFLNENARLIPDVSETFIVAFATTHERTLAGLNDWLARQTTLRLKIFEVPTRTNEAGAVTKRVAFEYPFSIRTYSESRVTDAEGNEKLVSVEVQK